MLKGRNRKAGAEIRTFDCAFTGLRGLLPGIWRLAGSKLFRPQQDRSSCSGVRE